MYLKVGCSALCFKKCESELVVTSLLFSLKKIPSGKEMTFSLYGKGKDILIFMMKAGNNLNV